MWRYVAEQRDLSRTEMRGVGKLACVTVGTSRNRGREKVTGERNKVLSEKM
jgi:hypothetical protein